MESEQCGCCMAVLDEGSLKIHAHVGVAVGGEMNLMTDQPFEHHKPKVTDPVSPVLLRRDAQMSHKFAQGQCLLGRCRQIEGHLSETVLQQFQHCG